MRKSLSLLILIFISIASNAQLGFIKDPDGFVNVRGGANNQSKIEDTLKNGRFIYHLQDDETPNNWLLVDYYKGQVQHSGYIHKSRIVFLKDLATFKEVTANDTMIKLELNDMQLTIKAGPFVKAGRNTTYDKPADAAPFLVAIDGKKVWGTDGGLPHREYRSIQFKSGATTLNFLKSDFNDLFEVSPHGTIACIDKATGKIYIEASNSDGAGSYEVVWVINKGKIVWREAFIPF